MERQVAICPLAGTALFQIQAPIPLDGEVDLSAAGLQAMLEDRCGRGDLRIGTVSWASAYRMNARLADRYRDGRVFLAGDAAHTHPPTGGQGLNTSMQDAYNLGWKLAAALAGAPDALLDSYAAERRPVAADMLGLSTRLLDAARRGDLRRGRDVRQLDLGYPASPLAQEAPDAWPGPLPGERAPDAPVRRADGAAMRLFDLFRGPHWTVFGDAVDRGTIRPHPALRVHVFGGDVADAQGLVADAYALVPGHWVLVRPDGHIGAIVAADRPDRLHGYLRDVGLYR